MIKWKIEKIISKGDYNYALIPGHPNATKNGYVLEHRAVVENSLGRLLNKKEIIHHKNKNKKDNKLNNLEISNRKKHSYNHGKMRGVTVVLLRCPECGLNFERIKRKILYNKYSCCSHVCNGKFSSFIQYHGITDKIKKAIKGNIIKEYKVYSGINT